MAESRLCRVKRLCVRMCVLSPAIPTGGEKGVFVAAHGLVKAPSYSSICLKNSRGWEGEWAASLEVIALCPGITAWSAGRWDYLPALQTRRQEPKLSP